MRVVFSTAALGDLDDIHDYICLSSTERADRFVGELIASGQALSEKPLAFPLVERTGEVRLRRKRHRKYLIFYAMNKRSVEIIRILHGARDYERLLFPDGDTL